ncbi:hypothetical protein PQR34_46765 [Paraburkholderia sediminicola]|uniref:hypothetical protein n=1 Tax=Paraburkholderia sediminicola TaxID=458836 RepID=UPI0038BC44DE
MHDLTKSLDDRTLYTVINENGERTTITLEKLVADALQASISDVHEWVQRAFDRVTEKKPELSRRERGDLVRLLAQKEAEKHPAYRRMIEDLLGPL